MPSQTARLGFTLAEVLITLGIIGVVAAITISGAVQRYTEKQTVIRLKHTYGLISQAVQVLISKYGNLDIWEDDSKEFFEQELIKELKIAGQVKCPYALFRLGACTGLHNINNNNVYALSNGVAISVTARPSIGGTSGHHCFASIKQANSGVNIHYGSCAYIRVDINGRNKPNRAGKDTFEFRVYADGVLPKGHIERNSNDGFDQCFNSNLDYNTNCTAWVIYHENMDYLKCRDKLHYDKGPYSCKEAETKTP